MWSLPYRRCWEISHSHGQLFYKPKCQMLVLDFSNKFRKSQTFVKLWFVLNLKWFNQDAFVDWATSHFRPQFWSWSCGCGQRELESHWYQLSRSCRRQACAQRKCERRNWLSRALLLSEIPQLPQVRQQPTKNVPSLPFIERKVDEQSPPR